MKLSSIFLLLITTLLILSSCESRTSIIQESHQVIEQTTPLTLPEITTPSADTTEIHSQVITETEIRSDPPKIDPDPVIIPQIPDALHTNILLDSANEILYEIYCTATENKNVSVYYADINNEFYFGINEDKKYHSASTIKAAYAQYLISHAIDLSNEIILTEQNRTSSSGKLNSSEIGASFTVEELLQYTIRDSDNQAYRLLYETFGTNEYNNYVTSIGAGGLMLTPESEWAVCSPKDLSNVMIEIYSTGTDNSILIDHLKNTSFNLQIANGTSNEVAHKYGYNGKATGYHDTAIVYAPSRPYVLTIMTLLDPADPETNSMFQKLTMLCDKLNSLLYYN